MILVLVVHQFAWLCPKILCLLPVNLGESGIYLPSKWQDFRLCGSIIWWNWKTFKSSKYPYEKNPDIWHKMMVMKLPTMHWLCSFICIIVLAYDWFCNLEYLFDATNRVVCIPSSVFGLLMVLNVLIHNFYLQLLSGGNHDIDVGDLKNNTRYTGGYSESSRTIKIFWEVLDLALITYCFLMHDFFFFLIFFLEAVFYSDFLLWLWSILREKLIHNFFVTMPVIWVLSLWNLLIASRALGTYILHWDLYEYIVIMRVNCF